MGFSAITNACERQVIGARSTAPSQSLRTLGNTQAWLGGAERGGGARGQGARGGTAGAARGRRAGEGAKQVRCPAVALRGGDGVLLQALRCRFQHIVLEVHYSAR